MRAFLQTIIIAGCVLSTSNLQAQNYDNPGEYMTAISQQQENISKKYMSYASAAAHGKKARKVENLRSKLLDEVQEARMNISGMPSYKGDKGLRDTAVNFMKLYFNVLNEDYSKIVNMEDIAEQSYDGMEAYLMAQELVDKKLDEGNDRMKITATAFAAKNSVNLIDGKSKLSDMTRKTAETNQYYHELYLIFFKAYIQESYLMDAAAKGNVTGIEQSKSALLKYAQDGLEKLKTAKPFDGDNSLLTATRNVLNFYVKEVNQKIGTMSDYFLTKERFEKTKKDYEKKSDPSKADRDAYNDMVNEINKASQAYNSTGQSLNKEKNDALNDYNKAVKDYFDEHTPHYK